MHKKYLIIGGIVLAVLLLAGFFLSQSNGGRVNGTVSSSGYTSNVSMGSGSQKVTIIARGGYSPSITIAKADTPTTISLEGQNAYGCESAVRIPQLNYATNLTPNGSSTTTLPPQKAGTTITGLCGMGMYTFQITFK